MHKVLSVGITLVAALWAAANTCVHAADQALIDAARKEGRVVWYTTQIIDQFARPAADAFQKKYGIKVDYVRANATEVALRILNEGRAGQVMADAFDGTSAVARLKIENMVERWLPDAAKRYPKDALDPEGYWIATNLYVMTPGFNTDLVPKGSEPKTFADLLNPKWKGKIAWNSSLATSAAVGFIGVVLADMGEEKGRAYLKELAKQNVTGMQVAARQVLDQVIAGEYSIALNIFNNHAVISASKGAPSGWIPMNPAMAIPSVISVTKNAPHPNAGKLLVDFLTSEDGQKLYRDADYMPMDPAIPPRDPSLRPDGTKFRAVTFTPEQIEANMGKWAAVFKDIFR